MRFGSCENLAQTVKSLSAVQETWVQSLGREDPPEKGMATHSSIHAWRIHGVTKGWTRLSNYNTRTHTLLLKSRNACPQSAFLQICIIKVQSSSLERT